MCILIFGHRISTCVLLPVFLTFGCTYSYVSLSVLVVKHWVMNGMRFFCFFWHRDFWFLQQLICQFSSAPFGRSVLSNSLWPLGLQPARPPCPSPTPGVYSNSCPLLWWCHPTISSSVVPSPSCVQCLSASGSFQMSQFFPSVDQNFGVSASASVFPITIQD